MKLSRIVKAVYSDLTELYADCSQFINQVTSSMENHHRESCELGLIDDEEKVKVLKQDLYRNIRLGRDTTELRKTIELLRKESNIQRKRTANRTVKFLDLTGFIVIYSCSVLLLFEFNKVCKVTDSTFCTQFKQVQTYFIGETNSNLLPENTEKK